MSKKIAITGASSGIGKATALLLAEQGHSLVLAARREDVLLDLSAQCLAKGAVAAVPVPCDVSQPEDLKRMALALGELPDALEPCLVSNAGFAEFGPFDSQSPAAVAEMIQVNLIGAIWAAQSVLPLMLGHGSGRIIQVCSVVAHLALPNAAAYSAAKAGLMHFGKCLATEVRRKGVLITNFSPGAVNTEIWDKVGGGPKREDMIPVEAVAEALVWILNLPPDRALDEMAMMPPKGLL